MTARDPFHEINTGRVNGSEAVIVFGRNPDMSKIPAPPEDVISQGGQYEGFEAVVAELLDIVSTSAVDGDTLAGAHDVLVFGLDENYEEISERLVLDGMTIVTTTKAYLRVNQFVVDNVGSGERNAGVISAVQETSGKNMSSIAANAGIAQQAVYTVPKDKVFFAKDLNLLLNDSEGLTGTDKSEGLAVIEVRNGPGKSWKQLFIAGVSQVGGGYNLTINMTRQIPAQSDLRARIVQAAEDNTDVTVRLTGILEEAAVVTPKPIPV